MNQLAKKLVVSSVAGAVLAFLSFNWVANTVIYQWLGWNHGLTGYGWVDVLFASYLAWFLIVYAAILLWSRVVAKSTTPA